MPCRSPSSSRPSCPSPNPARDLLAERVASAIQAEPGCELYAIHSDGSVEGTIECRESEAGLDAHLKAPSVTALLEQGPKFLVKAPEILPMQALGFGDPVKGTLQRTVALSTSVFRCGARSTSVFASLSRLIDVEAADSARPARG